MTIQMKATELYFPVVLFIIELSGTPVISIFPFLALKSFRDPLLFEGPSYTITYLMM